MSRTVEDIAREATDLFNRTDISEMQKWSKSKMLAKELRAILAKEE